MIWYVATLIASVISSRGLAAQGELKCSAPALPLPMFSAPSSAPQAPSPFERRAFPRARLGLRSGAPRGTAGDSRGRGLEGQGGRCPSPRAAGHSGKDTLGSGSTSPAFGPRSSRRRAEPGALSRSSGLLERWAVGGFPNSGCRGVCGCSGRLQHSRATAPRTSPCREERPRALGLSAPKAKGLDYRPCGRPPLQIAPLLTTNLRSQRSSPPPRAGARGDRREEKNWGPSAGSEVCALWASPVSQAPAPGRAAPEPGQVKVPWERAAARPTPGRPPRLRGRAVWGQGQRGRGSPLLHFGAQGGFSLSFFSLV